MIKLNDNKTKSNLLKLINREISFIDASLAYQRSLNKEVLLCMNLITQNSEVIETAMEFSKNYEALNNVMALLKKSTFNIDSLEALLSQLYEIKNNESNVVMTNKISKFNENYLDVIDEITTNTMKIECFLKADFQEVENQNKAIAESAKKVKVRTKEVNLLPNTLIISEIEKKVVLPYTLTDIKNILKDIIFVRNENVSESIDTSLYFIEIMSFYFSNISERFTRHLQDNYLFFTFQ